MKRLHQIAGVITVLVFLGTGQYMRHRHPAVSILPDTTRMLFRSAHIYLLLSGLINLILGIYFVPKRQKAVQFAGSILLLASPVFIFSGFSVESMQNGIDRFWTVLGVYMAFGGTMLHFLTTLWRDKTSLNA